jgi:hypothetical protein
MNLIRFALLAAVLVGVAACLSGTGPTPACGTFDGRMTGVADDSISGCAFFVVKESGDFGMVLTNGGVSDVNPAVKLLRGNRPGIGTHTLGPVVDDHCGAPAALCGIAVLGGQIYTLAGTVVVTQSDTVNVAGSLTVTGTSAGGAVLNISGSFAAPCHAPSDANLTPGGEQPGDARRATTCKPGLGGG